LLAVVLAVLAVLGVRLPGTPAAAQDDTVRLRVVSGEPFTWDPALAGDSGSAGVHAQVFEGLTAFDADSRVQPALADRWVVGDDGRKITFHLRPDLRYSDGSPIVAADVVGSWMRLIDPASPSPLASLLSDVEGAADYLAGRADREAVGLHADGDEVTVDLRRPATYFLAVTASPSMAVVPPSMHGALAFELPANIVVSGAYVPSHPAEGVIRLQGNGNYWAGMPRLEIVELVTDLGGLSPVSAFLAEDVDYTSIASYDASWISYDRSLGPQLRRTDSFSVHYYGFDAATPPFDDTRVRLAFAKAVDWQRIVRLATEGDPAGSLIPRGVPGRDDVDYRPAYDPGEARSLLADAGYPGGEGFPETSLVSFGYGYEETVATEIEENLGITLPVEIMGFDDYNARLQSADRPRIWTLSWIADYPHAHDFLGLLLETGSVTNYGRWSNADYDAAIEAAAAANDPAEQASHYAAAQQILREQAPIVPVEYGESWALSRDGLLGALESGVGMVRLAGLDWAEGKGR
jgi:oligopeptide transport system substrate-binding protein